MAAPLFPSLTPRLVDPLWFPSDKSFEDESEVKKLEEENRSWLQNIREKDNDIVPIGKTAAEHEEEDDEDDDGEDSESGTGTNDDELEADMMEDRDSPDEVDMETGDANNDSPSWDL